MPNNVYFGRDTRAFIVQGANVWEVGILNGYAANQGTNTSEVALNEMTDSSGNSRRGRTVFTDSQAPAEWSFDTYVRPTISATKHRAVEEPLWANLVANNAYAAGAWIANTVTSVATTSLDTKFDLSNKTELGKFDVVFVLGATPTATSFDIIDAPGSPVAGRAYNTTMYRVYDASVNEVSINFDIDGIATLSWSGNGARLREFTSVFDVTTAIRVGIDQTNNFIRNRLTQLTIIRNSGAGAPKTYNVTLTGGSITINNNLSYLTPEVLGRVNQPIGHVTGTRTINGSFTCYLDPSTLGSSELFQDISEDSTAIRNQFDLSFYIGGYSGTPDVPRAPGMLFSIPRAHLSVPTHDTGDVIALNVDFAALPADMGTPNEIDLIRYIGVAP